MYSVSCNNIRRSPDFFSVWLLGADIPGDASEYVLMARWLALGTTAAVNTMAITSCYVSAGPFSDTTGSGTYSDDCYYTK